MEINIISAIVKFFDLIGVSIPATDALLLSLFFIGMIFVVAVFKVIFEMRATINDMKIVMATLKTRVDMHADHFNVLDETHSTSLKASMRALELSAAANARSSRPNHLVRR